MENTGLTKVNTLLTKVNTLLTKVNTLLTKVNTLLTKVNYTVQFIFISETKASEIDIQVVPSSVLCFPLLETISK